MARRRKGRDVSGWVIVDKPSGIGSTPVVSKVRRAFDAKKAGHAGTLDPMASGVLAVALGEATKTVPYAMDGRKSYRFTVRWGAETDTDDAEGQVTRRSDARLPDAPAIRAALPALTGEVMQAPPAYSALKVDGKRAYELARAGEIEALPPRPVTIHALSLVEAREGEAELEMVCGKGGYVRAVARDLGRALGCLGHVTVLRREAAGPFDLSDAVSLDMVEAMGQGDAASVRLLGVARGLDGVPALAVSDAEAAILRNGGSVPAPAASDDRTTWASLDGAPVAIGTAGGGVFRPARVIHHADAEGET